MPPSPTMTRPIETGPRGPIVNAATLAEAVSEVPPCPSMVDEDVVGHLDGVPGRAESGDWRGSWFSSVAATTVTYICLR